jgi:hypothetical protein
MNRICNYLTGKLTRCSQGATWELITVVGNHLNPDLVFDVNQIVLCRVCAKNPLTKDQKSIAAGNDYGRLGYPVSCQCRIQLFATINSQHYDCQTEMQ